MEDKKGNPEISTIIIGTALIATAYALWQLNFPWTAGFIFAMGLLLILVGTRGKD